MKLVLLDEMYAATLAVALREAGVEATTVAEAGLAGRSDLEVLSAAIDMDAVVLTENVADFAAIAADHVTTGGHHAGVLIALSSRFSRRPSGRAGLVAAIRAIVDAGEPLADRVIYLEKVV